MRKLYWYLSAYLRKHGIVLAVSSIAALILFSFSITFIVRALEQKPRRFIGIVGEYTLSSLPEEVAVGLGGGLTRVEVDGSVSPLLAERWTVEDDGRAYRFVIRDDISWQDGKKLEPSDILYQFQGVETITTPKDIVFKLENPFAPFPLAVTRPVFREGIERHQLFFDRPTIIGIGPFRMIDYTLKPDKQHLEKVVLDKPDERRTYRFYLTEEAARLGFIHGEVDELLDIVDPGVLTEWNNVEVEKKVLSNRYLAVFFNNADPNMTKSVRQALSYAALKPTDATRAYGPINPQSWAYLEGLKGYEFDLERATERLFDKVPEQPILFELTTTPAFAKEAEQLKSDWQTFGASAAERCKTEKKADPIERCSNLAMQVNIKVTNYPDLVNYQAVLIGQESPPDPDQYALWHSEQSTNFTHYKNTRIDALLEKGRQVRDTQERKTTYQEFQQFFLEDAPALFIRYLESYTIRRKSA